MIKVLQAFHNGNGDAYLIKAADGYSVSVTEIQAPGIYRHSYSGRLSHSTAMEQYNSHVTILGGRPVRVTKCTCGGAPRRCCAEHCPDELGGAAFWEIFGNSCLYKQR